MRVRQSFAVRDLDRLKAQIRHWTDQFTHTFYLDSNEYREDTYSKYELLAGVGACDIISVPVDNPFEKLKSALDRDWWFGYLGYDLKNNIERLQSSNPDHLDFPKLFFFRPKIVLTVQEGECRIESLGTSPKEIWEAITAEEIDRSDGGAELTIKARMPKDSYLEKVQTIRAHIAEGDVYEMNLCQEFYSQAASIDPTAVFQSLNEISKAPFAVYCKIDQLYLMCSSPERFLAKRGNTLISQPIKGTIKRDKERDELLRIQLKEDEKERAENVMIVDLVRNDLSRSCKPGTVEVEELFGIYTFKQVHQMISTVKGELRNDVHPVDAIKNAFPMGSMTGAPKIMAMELIEQYEETQRGLYSGAVGYFAPDGDFDFNVVIRSILYNQRKKYLSYQVGGAITYDSRPEKEYEECLLKARALKKVLSSYSAITK